VNRNVQGMNKFAIYGCGGFGREVLPMYLQSQNAAVDIVFVDDDQSLLGTKINGHLVVSPAQAIADNRMFNIAIANPQSRKRIVELLKHKGASFFTITAGGVSLYDDVEIGEGSVLCAHVAVTSNIRIGKHFHANFHSYVAHDCEIGDYVTLAPHVSCGGRISIGDGAYIGMGAVIKQGTTQKRLVIGAGAVVGMGAVVTKDVPAGAVVIGNPALIVRQGA
jgi:sugar O-acyltransferase (sialic acid O-acetyltransferase NeuD family)